MGYLWDLTNLDTPFQTFDNHWGDVRSVAYSPDGQKLASAGYDDTVHLWDLNNPDAAPIVLQGHNSDVYSVAFHPKDSNQLVSASGDTTIRLWDLSAPLTLVGHNKLY